jgi:ABC-2 type transport system permease protein
MSVIATSRVAPGHAGFRHVLRMEWIKLRSLRSTRWTVLVAAVGTVGIGIAVLASYQPAHFTRMTAEQRESFDPTNMGFAGTIVAMIAFGVLGVLTVTGEYSSGMIRATLSAVPGRAMVLLAKATVFGAVALVVGELVVLGNFLAGEAVLTSAAPHASLGEPAVLRSVLLTGAFLALLGLVGLGLGTIIRHTAGAITAFIGGLFAVPMIVLMAGGESMLNRVGKFVPMFIDENSVGAVKPVAGAPAPWAGLGIMCVYAVVALGAGGWLLLRRDA